MTEPNEPKARELYVTEHDDAKWLVYECGGKPAQLDVRMISGVTPQSKGQSLLKEYTTVGERPSSHLCDSTSAEVLAVLGWVR